MKKQPEAAPKVKLTPEQVIAYAERQREIVGGGSKGLEAYWGTIFLLMRLM